MKRQQTILIIFQTLKGVLLNHFKLIPGEENTEEATAPRQNITTKSFGGFKRFKAQ